MVIPVVPIHDRGSLAVSAQDRGENRRLGTFAVFIDEGTSEPPFV